MERFTFFDDGQYCGFYLFVDEIKVGEVTFKKRKEDAISINHTQVEKVFQGKGYGKKLVDKVIEFAKENQLKLSASCWFADKVIQSQ